MASYDATEMTFEIPTEWRILLLLHGNNVGMQDEDGVAEVSEKGTVYANAIKSLYIHKDLYRFSVEMMEIGETFGA